MPLLILILGIATPHVDKAPMAISLAGIKTDPMNCFDLITAFTVCPMLILVSFVAAPHVYLTSLAIPLAGIEADPMNCLDLFDAISVLPLLVLIAFVAAPHVNFAPLTISLTGIEADPMNCFDHPILCRLCICAFGLAVIRRPAYSLHNLITRGDVLLDAVPHARLILGVLSITQKHGARDRVC